MNTAGKSGLTVVFDANVYVSAFATPEGEMAKLLRLAGSAYEVVISPAIASELGRVMRNKFEWPDEQFRKHLRALIGIASGDDDLLRLKSFRGIPIVHPNDFCRTLGTKKGRGRPRP